MCGSVFAPTFNLTFIYYSQGTTIEKTTPYETGINFRLTPSPIANSAYGATGSEP